MRDIGETAVRTLLDRLADPSAPRHTAVLPTELVLRTSCGCAPRGGSK
jgi:LacI family transcriptional regulator